MSVLFVYIFVAKYNLDRAIESGFEAPSVLHCRGSLALEMGENEIAIHYLKYAVQFSLEIRRNPDIPKADMVHEPMTYNQIGIAYTRMKQ